MVKTTPPEQFRVTTLSSIYTCGYKAKNEPYVADIANTYHGDIFNIYATSSGFELGDAAVDHYVKTIKTDIKLATTLKMLGRKVQEYVLKARTDNPTLMQEGSLNMKYSDVLITGTPDVVYYNKELELWVVEDLKCSTHSWYQGDDMRDFNLQTWIYPLFMMNYMGVDEVGFRYIVADKNTGKLKAEPPRKNKDFMSREDYVIRTRAACEEKLKEVMEDHVFPYHMFDILQARRNKLCLFCQFKDTTCPLRKTAAVVTSTVVDDDGL